MSAPRLIPFLVCLSIVFSTAAADESFRFTQGRGNIAVRVGDSEWSSIAPNQSLPAVCELRTSPVSSVRLDRNGVELSLSGDTSARIDADQQRIELDYGRVLLKGAAEHATWTIATEGNQFHCDHGTEVEVSVGATIGANVLSGTVARKDAAGQSSNLTAPLEWVVSRQGEISSKTPTEEEWASAIRRRTEPRAEQGLGQLVMKDPDTDRLTRLEIAQYHVQVTLQAPVALVQIDQSFFNESPRQAEGTYVFNLPEGASVSRFAMYVTPEELVEGELIDRRRADEIYTSIVQKRRDPAILEQIGTNLFRMRIFPILARDTKRILLDYTVPLTAHHGRYHFDLPLMSDRKPIWDFQLSGTILPPLVPGSITSPTHPELKFDANPNSAFTFLLKERFVKPKSRLTLDYQAPAQSEASIHSSGDVGTEYFVATIPAVENPPNTAPPEPADVLILVDTSGSTPDLKPARLAAHTIVRNLRPVDRWQLGCVDQDFRPLTELWLPGRTLDSLPALRKLDQEYTLGASRLNESITTALGAFNESSQGRRRIMIYIGDGEPDPSPTRFWEDPRFRSNAPDRIEFHSVQVGSLPESQFWISQAAVFCRGRRFVTTVDSSALRSLFEWTLAGMPAAAYLESLRVSGVDPEDLYFDRNWIAGRDLLIYGKGDPAASRTIMMKVFGQTERTLPATRETTPDRFAGRLWAQQNLETKLTLNHSTTDVVKLCQTWGLMSPYTAFLVLESEADYERWRVARNVRQKYWTTEARTVSRQIHDELFALSHQRFDARQGAAKPNLPAKQPQWPAPPQRVSDEVINRLLDSARDAIAAENPTLAARNLAQVSSDGNADQMARYRQLQTETRQLAQREVTLRSLSLWQRLLDRRRSDPLPAVSPLVLGLGGVGTNPEYMERHPQALKLLKPAPVFENEEITLRELAKGLEKATGVPVLINQLQLSEEGISSDLTFTVSPSKISARTFANSLLDMALLKLVPETNVLRITTQTDADDRVTTNVYPIQDLVHADLLPQPQQLSDPLLDYENRRRREIEQFLQQPLSVDFRKTPLADALDYVLDGMDYGIEFRALSEEGISTDQTISLTINNVSREFILNELLSQQLLDYVIHDDLLQITTVTWSADKLITRVYSAAGIVDEDVVARSYQHRSKTPFGYGFSGVGGFGGGMGGGMAGMRGMGGMGGGMGGFGGGGMGGMLGGGMPPGGGNAPAGNSNAATDRQPPSFAPNILTGPTLDDFEPDETPPTASSNQPQEVMSFSVPRLNFRADVQEVNQAIRWMQSGIHGKWMNTDGEGGSIAFHPPSFAFVLRQPYRQHKEFEQLLKKIRAQSPTYRKRDAMGAHLIRHPDESESNAYSLQRVIQQSTPGKWQTEDGEGGSINYHEFSHTLIVQQTEEVHEEIDALFAQLRRARVLYENLPSGSLEGIDDWDLLIDRPALTDLPKNTLDAVVSAAKPDELKLLAVRRVPEQFQQRWKIQSGNTGKSRDVLVSVAGQRLECATGDRILRTEGPLAAVAYPSMTLVEVDAWGDAVRQYADVTFPWLGHRSNEELSRLFDVTQESENDNSVTLRLTLPTAAEAFLRVQFSKATGQPVNWQSLISGTVLYELKFQPDRIVALAPDGKELESWQLVTQEPVAAIAPVREQWSDWIVTEPSNPESPLTQIREAFRRGRINAAANLLQRQLETRPQQPLWNFLCAWAARSPESRIEDPQRSLRSLLQAVARHGSGDLLGLITTGTFPQLSTESLYELMASVPAASRTAALWGRLSQLSADLELYDRALSELDRADSLTDDSLRQKQNHFKRIDYLLQLSRPIEADSSARALVTRGVTPQELLELATLFSRLRQTTAAAFYFDEYRRLPEISPRDKLSSTIIQGAYLSDKEARWRAILSLITDHGENPNTIAMIVSDADSAERVGLLNRLTKELSPGPLKLMLLGRLVRSSVGTIQARAALQLITARALSDYLVADAADALKRYGSGQEVITVLEQELHEGRQLNSHLLEALAIAYSREGLRASAARVGSQAIEATRTRR